MTSLGQRILWRAVPAGAATALIGYGLCQFYLAALQAYVTITVNESPDGRLQGPLIFGLAGFAITAAVECARKSKTAAGKPQRQTPVAVP